jgi:hypothetical protein
MLSRVCRRLLTGPGVVLIAFMAVEAGVPVHRKGAAALCMLIYLIPIGVFVAIDEFVVRPIRFGPPAPGRRRRGIDR